MPFLIMMTSVVIDDFYSFRAFFTPDKADSPLSVDTNAVLAFACSAERLQAVAGGEPKSVSTLAASSMVSFRSITLRMSGHKRVLPLRYRCSVRLHLKLIIIINA